MTTVLNVKSTIETSIDLPGRDPRIPALHLAEECGEVCSVVNRPGRNPEPLVGEVADVINCAIDLYTMEYGPDLTLLNETIERKVSKWRTVAGLDGRSEDENDAFEGDCLDDMFDNILDPDTVTIEVPRHTAKAVSHLLLFMAQNNLKSMEDIQEHFHG